MVLSAKGNPSRTRQTAQCAVLRRYHTPYQLRKTPYCKAAPCKSVPAAPYCLLPIAYCLFPPAFAPGPRREDAAGEIYISPRRLPRHGALRPSRWNGEINVPASAPPVSGNRTAARRLTTPQQKTTRVARRIAPSGGSGRNCLSPTEYRSGPQYNTRIPTAKGKQPTAQCAVLQITFAPYRHGNAPLLTAYDSIFALFLYNFQPMRTSSRFLHQTGRMDFRNLLYCCQTTGKAV